MIEINGCFNGLFIVMASFNVILSIVCVFLVEVCTYIISRTVSGR